jgi:hypothetical protein
MVIVRHEPGDVAPVDGAYVLVGHYGETTNVLIWCRKGERLPSVAGINGIVAPAWFVRRAAESSMRAAA